MKATSEAPTKPNGRKLAIATLVVAFATGGAYFIYAGQELIGIALIALCAGLDYWGRKSSWQSKGG